MSDPLTAVLNAIADANTIDADEAWLLNDLATFIEDEITKARHDAATGDEAVYLIHELALKLPELIRSNRWREPNGLE